MLCGFPSHNHPLDLRFNWNVNQRILHRLLAILRMYRFEIYAARRASDESERRIYIYYWGFAVLFGASNQTSGARWMMKKKEIRELILIICWVITFIHIDDGDELAEFAYGTQRKRRTEWYFMLSESTKWSSVKNLDGDNQICNKSTQSVTVYPTKFSRFRFIRT